MKIKNIREPKKFFETLAKCKGSVEFVTDEGDRLNMKSKLSQYIFLGDIRELVVYKVCVSCICNDVDVLSLNNGQKSFYGLLYHGLSVFCEGEKLLGSSVAALWPETLAPSACHDDCGGLHFLLFSFFSLFFGARSCSAVSALFLGGKSIVFNVINII